MYACSKRDSALHVQPGYWLSVGCAVTAPNVYLTAVASGDSVVSSVLQVGGYQVRKLLPHAPAIG
jgi:hypothetical protein